MPVEVISHRSGYGTSILKHKAIVYNSGNASFRHMTLARHSSDIVFMSACLTFTYLHAYALVADAALSSVFEFHDHSVTRA